MHASSLVVDKARQLAAAGPDAEVVEVEDSPTLSARGVVALVSGRIDEAADYFTQALLRASRDGDFAASGRCSNNLGIISNLRGRHAEAIGSWEIAVAAFERADLRHGVAECHHNLAIAHREQGAPDRALAEAERAVAEADAAGDRTLLALVLRGRAQVRLLRGELEVARRDLDEVREVRSGVPNPAGEAEDLLVAASVLVAEGQMAAAERALRDVIGRAQRHGRPQLVGEATRDLATLLSRIGRHAEARAAARTARSIFTGLGAEGDIRKLAGGGWDEDFAAELRGSLTPLHVAQELADGGRFAELMTYLSGRPTEELEQSPVLALLYGIAHGRLGRLGVGQQWATVAQLRARAMSDRTTEVRALNFCGAIALERGGIGEATRFFTRAQEEAIQNDDMAAVGRCANNLGIIANLQGDYAKAAGAYIQAITAYRHARRDRRAAESRHNLGIAYRRQGQLDLAFQTADAAVREAERLGDRGLRAQALAGRAEIRVARREPELAIREADAALAVHRELKDAARETEDLRILAVALDAAGKIEDAEDMLREVIDRATAQGRPELMASAQRDLAHILAREDKVAAATGLARAARATFGRLGAKAEVEKLDALLGEPR